MTELVVVNIWKIFSNLGTKSALVEDKVFRWVGLILHTADRVGLDFRLLNDGRGATAFA